MLTEKKSAENNTVVTTADSKDLFQTPENIMMCLSGMSVLITK